MTLAGVQVTATDTAGTASRRTRRWRPPAVFQGHELVSWLYNGQYLGAGSEVDLVTAPTGFRSDQLMLQYR